MKFKNKPSDEGGGDEWLTTYSDLVTLLLAFFVLLFSFSEIDATKWKELVSSFSGEVIVLEDTGATSVMDNDLGIFDDTIPNYNGDGDTEMEDSGNTDPEGENASLIDENENTDISESDTSSQDGEKDEDLGDISEEEDEESIEEKMDNTLGVDTSLEETEETSGNVLDEEYVAQQFDDLYKSLMFFNDNQGLMMEITRSEMEIKIRLSNNMLFEPEKANINKKSRETLGQIVDIVSQYDEIIEKLIMEGNTDNLPITTGLYRDNFELSLERALNVLYFFKYEGGFDPGKLVPMGYGEYNPVASNDTVEGRAKNRRTDVILVKHIEE